MIKTIIKNLSDVHRRLIPACVEVCTAGIKELEELRGLLNKPERAPTSEYNYSQGPVCFVNNFCSFDLLCTQGLFQHSLVNVLL